VLRSELMQSDFELIEYARERKIALRKNGLIMLAYYFSS